MGRVLAERFGCFWEGYEEAKVLLMVYLDRDPSYERHNFLALAYFIKITTDTKDSDRIVRDEEFDLFFKEYKKADPDFNQAKACAKVWVETLKRYLNEWNSGEDITFRNSRERFAGFFLRWVYCYVDLFGFSYEDIGLSESEYKWLLGIAECFDLEGCVMGIVE